MPYQGSQSDKSYRAQRNSAQQGGMQASGCGCGGAGQTQAAAGGCSLAAPAYHQAPCAPAPLHPSCCGSCSSKHGNYQQVRYAYGH